MKKTLAEIQREREQAELLRLALAKGFPLEVLERAWIARINASEEVISIREFLNAVNGGEYDYLLKDQSGQSYS